MAGDGKRPSAIGQRKAAADRVPLVAALVGRLWNADFRNVGNAYTDRRSGRVLQVISGHRPEKTGVMRFTLANTTLKALKSPDDVWFAFVPNEGEEFLLVPIGDVQWRSEQLKSASP